MKNIMGMMLVCVLFAGCSTTSPELRASPSAAPVMVHKNFAFETPTTDRMGNPLVRESSILGYNVYLKTNTNFAYGWNIALNYQGAHPSTNEGYTETFSLDMKSGNVWYVVVTATNVYGESDFSDMVTISLMKASKGKGLRVLDD